MKNLYLLFLNLGLSTVHIIYWRFFAQQVSAENEVCFTANCIRCSFLRFWCKEGVVKRDARPRALNRGQSATLSDSSNDSCDLSLSCSVSSVESEESEVSEVERDLETVEPYQFEPAAAAITQFPHCMAPTIKMCRSELFGTR